MMYVVYARELMRRAMDKVSDVPCKTAMQAWLRDHEHRQSIKDMSTTMKLFQRVVDNLEYGMLVRDINNWMDKEALSEEQNQDADMLIIKLCNALDDMLHGGATRDMCKKAQQVLNSAKWYGVDMG